MTGEGRDGASKIWQMRENHPINIQVGISEIVLYPNHLIFIIIKDNHQKHDVALILHDLYLEGLGFRWHH